MTLKFLHPKHHRHAPTEHLPRNIYHERIDFVALLNEFLPLKKYIPSPRSFSLVEEATFEFTRCNPLFYSRVDDVARLRRSSLVLALFIRGRCRDDHPGWRITFCWEDGRKSLKTRERCKWYTSILGKLLSVEQIVEVLKIANHIVTELIQGLTHRWAIGWSFHHIRLRDHPNLAFARCLPGYRNVLLPVSFTSKSSLADALSSYSHRRATNLDLGDIGDTPINVVGEAVPEFIVAAQCDTWSRSARRRQRNEDQIMDQTGPSAASSLSPTPYNGCCMIISISIKDPQPPAVTFGSHKQDGLLLDFCWRKGSDRNLFNSFCSHVSRKIL
ncbi:hypothetical protein GYMLUDRAFT_258913 [Collybiopsis luxurians FD-317 M1]|nr:hypothetical protein GYMLUDRAFT_258913 [Collybiopsis luxurians FD-317 M1]